MVHRKKNYHYKKMISDNNTGENRIVTGVTDSPITNSGNTGTAGKNKWSYISKPNVTKNGNGCGRGHHNNTNFKWKI